MKGNKFLILLLLFLALTLVRFGVTKVFSATAEENFNYFCAQCHGLEGKGDGPNATKDLPVSPKNLTDPLDIGKYTDEQVFNTLSKGGPANDLSEIMPPWGNTLSREEIKELIKFVRKLCNCTYNPKLKEAAQEKK